MGISPDCHNQFSTFAFAYDCTVPDMPKRRDGTEQTDWWLAKDLPQVACLSGSLKFMKLELINRYLHAFTTPFLQQTGSIDLPLTVIFYIFFFSTFKGRFFLSEKLSETMLCVRLLIFFHSIYAASNASLIKLNRSLIIKI